MVVKGSGTDGRTDGRTGRRMDGRMDGWLDGRQREGWTDGRKDRRMDIRMDGRMDRLTSGTVGARGDPHHLRLLLLVSFLKAVQLVDGILGGQRGERAELQLPAATPPPTLQRATP